MRLDINDEIYEVADSPPRQLLWVLRDELGLVGTKYGCGGGYCGACTVHIDGEAQRSCQIPVTQMAGKKIRTVEGLADSLPDGAIRLHPIQQAFIDEQVPQCAWCMSGQMMTAVAFLEQNAAPSDEEIVEAMAENYCRCGCYVRIKRAVGKAAETMADGSEA